jgi:hypothetical protein
MTRNIYRLAVVQPADGDHILTVDQLPKIDLFSFDDDLVCGYCDHVLMRNAAPHDAEAIVGESGRTLVKCPECGDLNLVAKTSCRTDAR